ncbi:hypothetical protein [Pseudonocardia sp. KRD291]|uniref:hypothetical protein n=1 Tax=Pseudonocardia sp. KRD291 TaxID=2792007 RepID=UPI001C4A6091|nr:hypothetical protein [Pseudonocardia sp. KRD291]MBW0101642.1 hypothetical protein [Pseudonocardia sp. KRD291]
MDPILTAFSVVAVVASTCMVLAWWRRRPWTAAAIGVVAALAVTPLLREVPQPVIVAGLLVLVGAAGWAVWPTAADRPTVDTVPESREDER